jgi:hypothetical protein
VVGKLYKFTIEISVGKITCRISVLSKSASDVKVI